MIFLDSTAPTLLLVFVRCLLAALLAVILVDVN